MHSLTRELQGLWQARRLLWALTRREIAARHAGTAAGVLWAYAQPLLTVAAYYLVFDVVFAMRLGDQAPTKAVGIYLITGSLPWMGFCDAVSRGMNSLLDAGSMLQKNALPVALFPARSVLASSLVFAPLVALLTVAYTPLHQFGAGLWALPALMLLQALLCLLMAYVLAILAAALRDVTQIVAFLLSVGIFMSPVLFPLTQFPEDWRWVLWLNPMTSLVLGYQNVLLQGQWPELSTWCVTLAWLGLLTVLLTVLVARSRDELVDWL